VTPALEEVLAAAKADAAILRRYGHATTADAIERVVRDVTEAAEDYLRWLSESDAQLRSGRSAKWLRGQFGQWERQGHARRKNGHRQYRMLVAPQRPHLSAFTTAYAAGQVVGWGDDSALEALREDARRAARGEPSARRRPAASAGRRDMMVHSDWHACA
jgi:hypothetical protein